MCGKPEFSQELVLKEKRHNDLESTSATLAAASVSTVEGKFVASTDS